MSGCQHYKHCHLDLSAQKGIVKHNDGSNGRWTTRVITVTATETKQAEHYTLRLNTLSMNTDYYLRPWRYTFYKLSLDSSTSCKVVSCLTSGDNV